MVSTRLSRSHPRLALLSNSINSLTAHPSVATKLGRCPNESCKHFLRPHILERNSTKQWQSSMHTTCIHILYILGSLIFSEEVHISFAYSHVHLPCMYIVYVHCMCLVPLHDVLYKNGFGMAQNQATRGPNGSDVLLCFSSLKQQRSIWKDPNHFEPYPLVN